MSVKSDQAVKRFRNGFNCSQAVLGSYCEQFDLEYDRAFKMATGFGGGMRMGGTCGAVSGAFMVLGLKYGNSTAEDKEAKEKTYKKVEEYTKRFKVRNDYVTCRELLGCDLSTPEGMKEAKDKNLFSSICPKMVQDAVEILEEMLAEHS
jgi:C_GCAxxG_C_C family probable redox protein